jgi:hypothetical protein
MSISVVRMFRQVLVLVLVLVIGFTSFVTPVSASEEYSPEEHPVKEFLIKATTETIVVFLPTAICLGADALATGFFPPAAALAPYCASFAVPAGGMVVASKGVNVAKQVLAH